MFIPAGYSLWWCLCSRTSSMRHCSSLSSQCASKRQPLPEKTKVTRLNDYRPVALTPTAMKCTNTIIPDTLDTLQLAYSPNRSVDDAISLTLHTALEHLDRRDTFIILLFIDFSSAFKSIVHSKLILKVRDLGLGTYICNWIVNFLTGRPQVVTFVSSTSSTLILNTGAPQCCCLSSMFTHDCSAIHGSNWIIHRRQHHGYQHDKQRRQNRVPFGTAEVLR